MQEVPIFAEPFSIPLDHYAERLHVHSEESQNYARKMLSGMRMVEYLREELGWETEIGEDQNIAVSMNIVGSDGRLEKATFTPQMLNGEKGTVAPQYHGTHIPSPMDLQVVVQLGKETNGNGIQQIFNEKVTTCRDNLQRVLKQEIIPLGLFEPTAEVKSLHSKTPSGYNDDSHKHWPSRVLDGRVLIGTEGTDVLLRTHLMQEITENRKRGRKIREEERNRARQYRKVCTGGTSSSGTLCIGQQYHSNTRGIVTHFDLNAGEVYYDRAKCIASFKYGPLRLVQMSVSYLIVRLLCSQPQKNGNEYIRGLPSGTAEKIRYLKDHHTIACDHAIIDRLIANYHFFLRGYHQSEWKAAAGSSTLVFAEDNAARKEVANRLRDLVEDLEKLT